MTTRGCRSRPLGGAVVVLLSATALFAQDAPITLERTQNDAMRVRFFAKSNALFRLESADNLAEVPHSVSGWFLGTSGVVSLPALLDGEPLPAADASHAFSVYAFSNGLSLIVPPSTNGAAGGLLVEQDYRTAPSSFFMPANGTYGPALVLVGTLPWNSAYNSLPPPPPDAAAKADELWSRYAEMTNHWHSIGAGAGAVPATGDGGMQFFRYASMATDDDGDGLSWDTEVFLTGTSPENAHSVSLDADDGLIDSDGDGIPDSDEIRFGLNLLVDESADPVNAQRFSYDALKRLRTLDSPGSQAYTLTLDSQGNVTRGGQ